MIRSIRNAKAIFLLVFLVSIDSAYAQIVTLGEPQTAQERVQDVNYRIGPGDLIDVSVIQSAALTKSGIRVSNTGTIQLAMIEEEIVAACKTERELTNEVKERYRKFLLNPSVTVAVQQFNSRPVAVIGAVNAPGRFQLQRPVRMLELLGFVNGPSEKAGNLVEIVRSNSMPRCNGSELVVSENGGEEVIAINIKDTLNGVATANPYVQAGDIVRVSESGSQAIVLGGVNRPTAINLRDPVTLSEAIAIAGGLSIGAQSEKIVVRRQIDGSFNRTAIAVNLKDIKSQKKDDFMLHPNDIVEVPGPGKITSFFMMLLPSLASLPMRAVPPY